MLGMPPFNLQVCGDLFLRHQIKRKTAKCQKALLKYGIIVRIMKICCFLFISTPHSALLNIHPDWIHPQAKAKGKRLPLRVVQKLSIRQWVVSRCCLWLRSNNPKALTDQIDQRTAWNSIESETAGSSAAAWLFERYQKVLYISLCFTHLPPCLCRRCRIR